MLEDFKPNRFSIFERCWNFLLKRNPQIERIIGLNHMIPKNNINNSINTQKYTLFDFLPKFLFQELQISINIIFLSFCVFNWFFHINDNQFDNLFFIHLIYCLVTDAFKDLYLDIKSYRSDKLWNERKFTVLSQHQRL